MSTEPRAWVKVAGPETDSLEFSVSLTGLTYVDDLKDAV